VERKNSLKQNKIGHLEIKNCKFERDENFKYLGVILNEDNNYQVDMQERIKNADKTYFMLRKYFKNKNTSKKLKLILKNTTIDKMLTYASKKLKLILKNTTIDKMLTYASKKLKLILKNTTTDKMLTYASETWILTKRDRKQMNIFERKVYRRILGPVYDNEKKIGGY